MGEIADMMLEGDLCECCGTALMQDKSPGFPMYCSNECAKDRGIPKSDWRYLVDGHDKTE